MKHRTAIFCILFLIFAQIPLLLPFFHKGIFASHDNIQIQRIFEMYQAIRYYRFPSYWNSELLYGYGYPLFTFYPYFVYILGAGFVFLGANFIVATKLVFITGFLIGAVGTFLLAKKIFNSYAAALVSSVAFSLAPYRAVDVYVRGALAEFFAFSLMPLVVWMNINCWGKETRKRSIVNHVSFSILLSLVILSHNISAVVLLFLLVPLNLYYFINNRVSAMSKVLGIILSGVLAFVLTCFYWLPILIELPQVRLGFFKDDGGSILTFQGLDKLWHSPWGFLDPNVVGGMSLMLGKILLVSSLSVFVLNIFFETKLRGLIFTLLVCGAFYIFLVTDYSSFIWSSVPFFRYFGFPWRFHTITTLVLSILTGAGVFFLRRVKGKYFLVICSAIILALFLENYALFNKVVGYGSTPITQTTTTWGDEYTPIWVVEKPKGYPLDNVWIASGSGVINNIEWEYFEKKFSFDLKTNGEIRIAHIYYPGWQAYIDGKKTKIFFNNRQGLMTIEAPRGQSNVKFVFEKLWYRQLSVFVSILGFTYVAIRLLRASRLK